MLAEYTGAYKKHGQQANELYKMGKYLDTKRSSQTTRLKSAKKSTHTIKPENNSFGRKQGKHGNKDLI